MTRTATASLTLEGEVTDDGRLIVSLPPDAPRGPVRVTVEVAPEILEISEDDVRGLGMTAEEIASSPDLGTWGQKGPVPDGASFVEAVRSLRPSYRW